MKPDAIIRAKIIASVVLSFSCLDVFQIGEKLNRSISAIRTLPKSENSSINIFSVKYEDIPSVRNNPNFKNTVNIVNKMPHKCYCFFHKIRCLNSDSAKQKK
jgi:hypothetical protein